MTRKFVTVPGQSAAEFIQLVNREKNKGKLISLGVGESIFKTPDTIIKATNKAINCGYTKYSEPAGLEELRRSIARKLRRENKIKVTEENIVVTNGAKQALFLTLMALLEPEDEVVNINPCYVSYLPQVNFVEPKAKIKTVNLKKHNFSINWSQLSDAINSKTKLIIFNFPHNPTGKILNKLEYARLVSLLKNKKCYIVSDEIYEKWNFSQLPYFSLASSPLIRKRVITINSFSKVYGMTGWRIGYLAADVALIKRIIFLQRHINTCVCTFIQKGTCVAFSVDEDIIDAYNQELREKVTYMKSVFLSNPKIDLISPQGGGYGFANIKKTKLSSNEFCSRLITKKRVVVTPGIIFGQNWDDHIRISLTTSKSEFKRGIDFINEFINELR